MDDSEKPSIETSSNGPYIVTNLTNFSNSVGKIDTKPVMALCRCGSSENKPFCDGTHAKIGFSGDKKDDRVPDKIDNYTGKEIIIHDNRGVCSHSAICTDNLTNVFKLKQEPWIDPNGEQAENIAEIIKKCPSGALSYTINNILHKDLDREPAISVSKNGPYYVTGGPTLTDEVTKSQPESKEHFTLCRCGGSKNKPFCDGTHWSIKFEDEKN